MTGDVSVVLPFRDVEKTLGEALSSVLAEAVVGEVIAVDDGSRDGSAEVARAIAARDGRVTILSTGGVGVAGALARGVAAAQHPWIARMDGDDVSLPGRIEAARAALVADATLGAVGTQVRLEVLGGAGERGAGAGMARYVAWQNETISAAEHAREIFVEAPLCHPSVVLRRAALDAVGGYQEQRWPQDYDLWHRLVAAGWGLAKVPEVLFTWRHRAGRVTFTNERNAPPRLVEARAHYLAPRLVGRPFWVWGAGDTGKDLARALEPHGALPEAFADIDPKKLGRLARGKPVRAAEEALAGSAFVVVAVGAPGARATVRGRLVAAGKVEGRDFVCAA